MVDDEILLPDRGKAIAAVIADAVGIARRVGHEFEIRPVELRELRHLVQRQHAVDFEHAAIGGTKRALHKVLQLGRHVCFDVEPDHQSAATALQRGLEQPHQVFGFFKDFQFGVADNTERADSLHRIAWEELADKKTGRAFDRDQPDFSAFARLRQPHESLDAVRHADERVHRLAILGARQLQGHGEAKIGNERERMRRIDRKRRQQRENVREEIIFKPGFFSLADVGTIDQHNAGFRKRGAQFAPLCLLILDQQLDRLRRSVSAVPPASVPQGFGYRCPRAPAPGGRRRGP